jgi:hypothetical protein
MEVFEMENEVKFAGTVIEVANEVVAKVTSFSRNISVSETEVTGAEDVIAGTDVLQQQFVAISVGETANIEGIAIESQASGADIGQSELKDAAESGDVVELKQTRMTGYGVKLTGFFTSYTESGSTSDVYKFSGGFRVNSKEEIVPAS